MLQTPSPLLLRLDWLSGYCSSKANMVSPPSGDCVQQSPIFCQKLLRRSPLRQRVPKKPREVEAAEDRDRLAIGFGVVGVGFAVLALLIAFATFVR